MTSPGSLSFWYSSVGAAGNVASNNSAGVVELKYTSGNCAMSTSSTGIVSLIHADIDCVNTTCLTTAGTGVSTARYCTFVSGTSSCVSVGAGTTVNLHMNDYDSTNAAVIGGAGTIQFSSGCFSQSGSNITPTTITPFMFRYGMAQSSTQPAFLAYNSATDTSVTGNGTTYTIIFDSEVFDQNSNYNNSTGTFTAPNTGRYHLNADCLLQNLTVGTLMSLTLVTSNRSYPFNYQTAASNQPKSCLVTHLCDMDAADTCTVTVRATGEAADTNNVFGGATLNTAFSGYLEC